MSAAQRTTPRGLLSIVEPWSDTTPGAVVVDLDAGGAVPAGWSPGASPVVIVGTGSAASVGAVAPEPFDVLITTDDPMAPAVLDGIERHRVAASALAVLLRSGSGLDVEAGLAAESAVYSTLQSGAEFVEWRRRSTARRADDDEAVVLVERAGADLHVVLNRPVRHNAVNTALRDALVEALTVAVVDDSIERVHLRGAGPSFCSGGDLGEFGTFPDPAVAHLTRLARSPARLLHRLADRLHVEVHGSCLGAGAEWPSFAATVTSSRDATFGLPELALGLVPGAGGTVSIPRRIGRHRTMTLALSGITIDASTALAWGLIDGIARTSPER